MSTDLPDWLHAVRQGVAQAAPRAGAFAQHVHVLPTTGSTNDDVARAALEGAPEGYTVVAAEQTAGRGRRGATWHSPATHGLYLSTLLRPERWPVVRADPASPASSLVTLMAGVAVASAVRDVCDAAIELKWPNDVMVRVDARQSAGGSGQSEGGNRQAAVDSGQWAVGSRQSEVGSPGSAFGVRHSAFGYQPAWRKLAGILAEGASEGGVLRSVVLGIGINLRPSAAPPDVAGRMVTLHELEGLPPRGVAVDANVAALLIRLREGCELLARGDLDSVRDAWCRLAPSVRGTMVRWHHLGATFTGRAAGIDEAGALRVRTLDAGDVTVHGGDVEWLLAEGEA